VRLESGEAAGGGLLTRRIAWSKAARKRINCAPRPVTHSATSVGSVAYGALLLTSVSPVSIYTDPMSS